MARRGKARQGMARARQGQGMARARQGMARHVKTWQEHGKAWQGMARAYLRQDSSLCVVFVFFVVEITQLKAVVVQGSRQDSSDRARRRFAGGGIARDVQALAAATVLGSIEHSAVAVPGHIHVFAAVAVKLMQVSAAAIGPLQASATEAVLTSIHASAGGSAQAHPGLTVP